MKGRYRRITRLEGGGMGEVWVVYDEVSKHERALKLLHAQADAAMKTAFAREIRILSHLHHPCIPCVIEQVNVSGRDGVIMELVKGSSMAWLMRESPHAFTQKTLLDWAEQLLKLLIHIHDQGILYLDLKPEHILLDQNDRLHLIDFGIARFQSEQRDFHEYYGTVGYSPPEQYEKQILDETSDIYAFGKTMIALSLQLSDGSKLRHLRGSDTSLSPRFRHVLDRCVDEQSALRYASARDVLNALSASSYPNLMLADAWHSHIQKQRRRRQDYRLDGQLRPNEHKGRLKTGVKR